jgi:hypothetical protein
MSRLWWDVSIHGSIQGYQLIRQGRVSWAAGHDHTDEDALRTLK